jgi:tRNA(Ile)-lysidine synthase
MILDRTHLKAGDRVCVAMSGGADSTALLLTLVEANTPTGKASRQAALGVAVSAVHVHHGLRGAEADADEAFVRSLCAQHGVSVQVVRVDTAARQASAREGVEEAARAVRYEVFSNLFARGETDVIVTAHTLDDQAETVLMKLLRGAWTDGLCAIAAELPWGAGRVVRPLLGVSRAQVEVFLRERGQLWQTDSTNADTALLRNRIRHEVMPLLRAVNPQTAQSLANVATLAAEDEAFWAADVERHVRQLVLPGTPVRGGGRAVSTSAEDRSVALEIERLKPLPRALRGRLLRAAARGLGVRLSFDETRRLLALAGLASHAETAARVGAKLELREGLRAERSARELRLSRQGIVRD